MAEERTFTIKVRQYDEIPGIYHEPIVQIRIRDNINGHDFSIGQRGPDKIGALTLAIRHAADFLVAELKGGSNG